MIAAAAVSDTEEEMTAVCSSCTLPQPRNPAVWCALWGTWLCANCRWARTEMELLDGRDPEKVAEARNPAWRPQHPELPIEEEITL